MFTVDTRRDRREDAERAARHGGRPRFKLAGPRPLDASHRGGYQIGRLPTADEQALGIDPYADEDPHVE